jgi:hypothetical protein
MKLFTTRITSAHVISLIALFVALGGTVYAAAGINGKTIKRGSIPGNRLARNGVTGAQINEGTIGQVPAAASADTAQRAVDANRADKAKEATTATTAKTATTATSAEDAKALGGKPASLYQARCLSGAVRGTLVINTSFTTQNEYAPFPGFNCAGGAIEVLHAANPGEYFVKFDNLPGGPAATVPAEVSVLTTPAPLAAKVRSLDVPVGGETAPGFLVQVYNTTTGAGTDTASFSLVVF